MLPPRKFKGLRTPEGYPDTINTLGDHIRAARLKRGQQQKDVAGAIGVTAHTIMHWELNQHKVSIPHYPKIMAYLRYCPVSEERERLTLGALVRRFRTHRGQTLHQAATLIGVDPGALGAWETGRRNPAEKSKQKLRRYIKVY